MADDPRPSNFANNGALIFALLSAVALAFSRYAPLQVARPVGEAAHLHQAASVQDVDARLWQDPFSVVARAEANRKSPLDCTERKEFHCRNPVEQLEASNNLKGVDTLFILVALQPGSPYAEVAEDRRRTRYAIVSGLDRMGFAPDDAQHIAYFHAEPKLAGSSEPQRPSQACHGHGKHRRCQPEAPVVAATGGAIPSSIAPITIPFELFIEKAPSGQISKALVLWVDESKLRKSPLSRLDELLGLMACAGDKCPTIKRQIIGPRSSDTLRGMIEEARAPPSTGGWRNLADAPFFAYAATVPDSIVLNGLNSKSAEDYLRDQAQLSLSRTIASDEALARAIVDELKLRGVEPGPDQQVMLISESDTLYGRTAPESFEKAFIESAKKTHPAGAERPGKWIFERTFLHGLDGALPQSGKDDNKSETPSKAAKGQSEADIRDADRPYGQGQDDYLRRLADDLKAQDTEGRDKTRAGVAAIGVIGGDVFDKLRVFRALKPEFPEALFFTTDYDAALTMQSELRFTRNLLVASSFGPQLRPERQCHIPPFRDVYESSAFLATQLAMTEARHPASCPSPNGTRAPEPKTGLKAAAEPPAEYRAQSRPGRADAKPRVAIFEIARTGDLVAMPSKGATQEPNEECSADLRKCDGDFQPEYAPLYPRGAHWLLIPAAGFLLFALISGPVIRSRYRNTAEVNGIGFFEKLYRLYWPIVLGFFGVALLLVWFHWEPFADWLTETADGEPMKIMLGVSVWPAIALRVATFLIAIWLIGVSFVKMRQNLDEISKAMGLASPAEITAREGDLILRGLNYLGASLRFWRLYDVPARKDVDYDVDAAWRKYVDQSRVLPTIVRTLIWVGLTFILLVTLFKQFGPPLNPARGYWIHQLYFWLTRIDVLLMWFLVFLVVDATLFCYLFVRHLSRGHSNWKNIIEERFATKIGIDYQQLPFDRRVLNDWVDLAFIGKRTACINSLIWYPFGVIALMIISRSSIFGNFPPNAPIIITQGVSLAIVFGCAFLLNGVAEDARALAAKGLADEIDKAKGDSHTTGMPLLEHMLQRVQNLQEGSFRPFLRQPVIGAILLPISSIGWTTLFEQAQLFGL